MGEIQLTCHRSRLYDSALKDLHSAYVREVAYTLDVD